MKRIDKENYYLDIAETVLERSTCHHRQERRDRFHRVQRRAQGAEKLHGSGLLHSGGHECAQRRAV